LKLREISRSDDLVTPVVNKMVETSTVLEFAEFTNITGNVDGGRKQTGASGGRFRALDADYPANAQTPEFLNVPLKIFGDKVSIDKRHVARGADVDDLAAIALISLAESISMNFTNYFFNADSATTGQFDGLKKIIPAAQKLTAATNGLTVVAGNDNAAVLSHMKLIELLMQLLGMVKGGAQVIYMNYMMQARLTSIASTMVTWLKDEFGRPVAFFNGVPLRDPGYDSAGNLILPNTEVTGTSGATCTSIYAVRFGETNALRISTAGGVDVWKDSSSTTSDVYRIEFDAVPALANDKAVARLEGVKLG